MTEQPADDEVIAFVIDVKQRRPGCVIIQAMGGCNSSLVSSLFPVESWLLAPTDDMYRVSGTMEEWRGFAEELKQRPREPR